MRGGEQIQVQRPVWGARCSEPGQCPLPTQASFPGREHGGLRVTGTVALHPHPVPVAQEGCHPGAGG